MKILDILFNTAKNCCDNTLVIGVVGAAISSPALANFPQRSISLVIPYGTHLM
ncbi:MAG: hypothetical protein ACI9W6_000437 [Motiliproteus sp.]|jgi:hypothetical protein